MYNIETIIYLLIISLATFRVANMLYEEALPFNIGIIFRHIMGIRYPDYSGNKEYLNLKETIDVFLSGERRPKFKKNTLSELVACFWCLSIWVAFILIFLNSFVLNLILASSTLAIIIKEKF